MSEKRPPKKRWANRIVGYGEEAPDQLLANPRNARIHPQFQQDGLRGALDEVGWVQNIIVNRASGAVVDGHLRVALALRYGQPTVPITYVELSDAEEAEIMAVLDPITGLAAYDSDKMLELLAEVSTEDEALQQLVLELAEDAEAGLLADAGAGAPGGRDLGDPRRQIKAVLYTDDVGAFEQALRLTGEANRGRAILEVCREYIERHEAGPLELIPEG